MPFDGSGNYSPAAAPNFPALSGATINSTYYNAVINDLATAMSNTLTKDGQGKPSVNFNWNGKSLTNVNALGAVTGAFSGAVTMSTTLGVTGAVTLSSSLSVTGQSILSASILSQDANAFAFKNGSGSNPSFILRNDGTSTYFLLSNAATGNASTTYNALRPLAINMTTGALTSVNGQTLSGGLTANNGQTFNGGTTIVGAATLSSTLGVTGATTLSSTLGVTGAVTFSNTLAVTGAATFNSTVAASGRTTSNGFTSTPIGAEGGEIHLQSTLGGNGFLLDVGSANGVRFYNYQNTNMAFYQNNGTEVLTILANGNVGVNNNAPATKLDVVGTLNTSGAVTFGSTLNVTGTTTLSTPLARNSGGTGLSTAPTNGQILIGNGSGYALSTITAGSNVSVTNGAGTITISATGTVTSVAVSGGTTGLSTSGGPITGSGTITLAGTLVVANGGTGSTTASGARTNLGAAVSGANNDITSLSALSTSITIAQGGTGSTTAAGARTNLGLGTVATQNANALTVQNPTFDSAQWATVSGTPPLFGVRAWASAQGRGTNGASTILGSGNIASITRSALGKYDVVFTTAMPDANYAVSGSLRYAGVTGAFTVQNSAKTTAGFTVLATYIDGTGAPSADPTDFDFMVVR